VNYVGEAIAFVVAEDRYVAEDAVDRIRVDYEFLEPVVGIAAARSAERLVHDDVPGNVGARIWSRRHRRCPRRRIAVRAAHGSALDLFGRALRLHCRSRAVAPSRAGTPTPPG
jgi:carbon-monoxide dehydrogenase large subunit